MKKDTIFDGNFTILDFFKFLILGYTAYATFTLVAGVSNTDAVGQYVRPLIAVAIVEGGLLFAEKLEAKAKNDEQAFAAQIAHFASIILIVFLAISSVLVELTGADILASQVRMFGFIAPLQQVAEGMSGILLALWIGFCLVISLYYNAKDPDTILAREKTKSDGVIATKRNDDYKIMAIAASPVMGRAQALEELKKTISALPASTQARILEDAENAYREHNVPNQLRPALPPPAVQMQRAAEALSRSGSGEDDDEPIPAEAPFIPVMRPANRIANEANANEGNGNFPPRRVPPYHSTMRPMHKRNPNV